MEITLNRLLNIFAPKTDYMFFVFLLIFCFIVLKTVVQSTFNYRAGKKIQILQTMIFDQLQRKLV